MSQFGDQDGKSKTASGVDLDHYPPVSITEHAPPEASEQPTHAEIAARAHQRWLEKGCRAGSHEEDWLVAERELSDAALSRRQIEISHQKGGSVQN
jgi:hypothetical protein